MDQQNVLEITVGASPVSENIVDLVYPCFILDNIFFDKELEYILSETGVPAYFLGGNGSQLLGYITPSVPLITRAKFLKIKIEFHRSETDIVKYDSDKDYLTFITF